MKIVQTSGQSMNLFRSKNWTKPFSDGHTEMWDLADYFHVTEDFMRKAVCWYTYGNLATELYF